MQQAAHQGEKLAGNTDTTFLKFVALAAMLVDHMGASMFAGVGEMRVIGRIAMPLYAWCLVVGCVKTRDPFRYALRMLGLALVSQPLYMLALNHTWKDLNILFLLTLGVVAITGVRKRFYLSQFWAPALCFLALGYLKIDYGWRGLAFMLLLYAVRGTRAGLVTAYIAYAMFWGGTSGAIQSMFGVQFAFLAWPGIGSVLSPLFRLQGMIWLALPLVACPTNTGLRIPRWLGYALYPLHLVLLALMRLAFTSADIATLVRGF